MTLRILRNPIIKVILLPYIVWHAHRLNRKYRESAWTRLRWHWWRRQWEFADGTLPPPIRADAPVSWRNYCVTYDCND